MDPADYNKKLEEAGKNGMSLKQFLKNGTGLEQEDTAGEQMQQKVQAYTEDPYRMMVDYETIRKDIKNNPAIAGSKDFVKLFTNFSKNQDARIIAFLKHFGLPEDFLTNEQLSIENFEKIMVHWFGG